MSEVNLLREILDELQIISGEIIEMNRRINRIDDNVERIRKK